MNNVKIYTFKQCPYCIKAKQLLEQENISYTEIEVSFEELDQLEQHTRCGTVPQIFIEDDFIGGCDDLFMIYRDKQRFQELFKK